jgi:hypothetical protein
MNQITTTTYKTHNIPVKAMCQSTLGIRKHLNNDKAITIDYKGFRENMRLAVFKVNQLLRNELFFNQLRKLRPFDMADISPTHIADLMENASIKMSIDLYYSLSPFNDAYGYDNLRNPNVIPMNVWQLERPIASLCNTMVHACVHAVNAYAPQYFFGHDDSTDVEHTAPYQIGCLAQQFISGDDTVFEYMRHEEYIAID